MFGFRTVILSCRNSIISTVLVFAGFLSKGMSATSTATSDISAWEFAVTRCSRVYPPRSFKGLLVADHSGRSRITIYWLQPPLICEKTDNLAYSDMIFQNDIVSCWLHKDIDGKHSFNFHLAEMDDRFRLPGQNDLMAILQSVFGTLREVRRDRLSADEPWEMARFFQGCSNRSESEHRVLSKQTELPGNKQAAASDDSAIMNTLPFGRIYRKKILADNSYVWQIREASANRDVVTVTIRPLSDSRRRDMRSAFDPDTLGRWSAVPEPYRRYWAFLSRYTELGDRPDGPSQARKLYSEINSYLGDHLPEDARSALNELRFKIALMTALPDAISQSTREYVSALCERDEASTGETIVELGSVAAKVRKQWSDKDTRDLVYPLLKGLIRPSIFANLSFLESMVSQVKGRGWYWYGQLLIDILQEQNCVDANILDNYLKDLGIWRLSKDITEADPNTLTPSMREFLTYLDSPPPEGQLTFEDLRHVLDEGLAGFGEQPNDEKKELIEKVLASIRMIAGDGPFQGDKDRLSKSLIEFERLQRSARVSLESMHALLTTFVALSFYDTSTEADHETLISQLHHASEILGREISEILERHQLSSLVSQQDVRKIFARPPEDIRRYVDDPLWPMFKYPMTENEQTRLINEIRTCLKRVERHAESVAQKLPDSADSQLVRRRLMRDVANIAGQIPYQAVCIRRPRYPGLSCEQSSTVGLHLDMKGHFYDSPDKAREVFQTMKYFYLGHRIEPDVGGKVDKKRSPQPKENTS